MERQDAAHGSLREKYFKDDEDLKGMKKPM